MKLAQLFEGLGKSGKETFVVHYNSEEFLDETNNKALEKFLTSILGEKVTIKNIRKDAEEAFKMTDGIKGMKMMDPYEMFVIYTKKPSHDDLQAELISMAKDH
jgi:hypothetical protein